MELSIFRICAWRFSLLAFGLFLFSLLTPTEAKVSLGYDFAPGGSWEYIDKFCFAESGGWLFVSVEAAGTNNVVSFYADREEQWPNVYGNHDLSCDEKVTVAPVSYPISGRLEFRLRVISVRPRWWYLTVSNCRGGVNGTGGVASLTSYNFTFTNSFPNKVFEYQFSKDEHTIGEQNIFFLILNFILVIVLGLSKREAKTRGMQYQIIKLLFVAVLIDTLNMLCHLIHIAIYTKDGQGAPSANDASFFFEFLSIIILLLIVLLMSQGWPVSTNFVQGKRTTFLFIFFYFLFYLALYVWSLYARDPASTLYIYESPPGYALVALRLFTILVFLNQIRKTIHHEYEDIKKKFYYVFALFGVCWLVALPLIVLIALYTPSWQRAKIVYGLVRAVQALTFWLLWLLFTPFKFHKYNIVLDPQDSRPFGSNALQIFPGNFNNF